MILPTVPSKKPWIMSSRYLNLNGLGPPRGIRNVCHVISARDSSHKYTPQGVKLLSSATMERPQRQASALGTSDSIRVESMRMSVDLRPRGQSCDGLQYRSQLTPSESRPLQPDFESDLLTVGRPGGGRSTDRLRPSECRCLSKLCIRSRLSFL